MSPVSSVLILCGDRKPYCVPGNWSSALPGVQVFLGSAHAGGSSDILSAEKTGVLASLLVDLARSKDLDEFPPQPDAAMVRRFSQRSP